MSSDDCPACRLVHFVNRARLAKSSGIMMVRPPRLDDAPPRLLKTRWSDTCQPEGRLGVAETGL